MLPQEQREEDVEKIVNPYYVLNGNPPPTSPFPPQVTGLVVESLILTTVIVSVH